MLYYGEYASPVGKLLLCSDGDALTGLWIDREAETALTEDRVLAQTKRWLDAYFRGEVPEEEIPLLPAGTEFQKLIWQLLRQIPYGETRSYGQLATEAAALLGKEKMSAQAVGQAVGSNPISILVPCHRVVGSKGQPTGYAWGVEKKLWLLRHEKENAL